MDRRWVVVVVGALLLGAVVMGRTRDTAVLVAPSESELPVVAVPAPAAAPAPVAPAPAEVELTDDMLAEEVGRLPPAERLDGPESPIDPDQTFSGDLRGVVAAAVSRRERFVDCFDTVRLQDPEDPGYTRFTLELTVALDGSADARVVTGPDDLETQTCVAQAMADAKFGPLAEQQSVTWTVPLPDAVMEPDDEVGEDAEEDALEVP
jgi:hypothetical protein